MCKLPIDVDPSRSVRFLGLETPGSKHLFFEAVSLMVQSLARVSQIKAPSADSTCCSRDTDTIQTKGLNK